MQISTRIEQSKIKLHYFACLKLDLETKTKKLGN